MKRSILVIVVLAVLFGCCNRRQIAEQQSVVVDLTIRCKDGDRESCNKIDEEVLRLQKLMCN